MSVPSHKGMLHAQKFFETGQEDSELFWFECMGGRRRPNNTVLTALCSYEKKQNNVRISQKHSEQLLKCYIHVQIFGNQWIFLPIKQQTYLSQVMRKPVEDICEQQRRRSACASAQSYQHLCYSLYCRTLEISGLCSWAGQFESNLVENPEDMFFSWRGSYNLGPYSSTATTIIQQCGSGVSQKSSCYYLVIANYRKFPKYSDTQKIVVITLKFSNMALP